MSHCFSSSKHEQKIAMLILLLLENADLLLTIPVAINRPEQADGFLRDKGLIERG